MPSHGSSSILPWGHVFGGTFSGLSRLLLLQKTLGPYFGAAFLASDHPSSSIFSFCLYNPVTLAFRLVVDSGRLRGSEAMMCIRVCDRFSFVWNGRAVLVCLYFHLTHANMLCYHSKMPGCSIDTPWRNPSGTHQNPNYSHWFSLTGIPITR